MLVVIGTVVFAMYGVFRPHASAEVDLSEACSRQHDAEGASALAVDPSDAYTVRCVNLTESDIDVSRFCRREHGEEFDSHGDEDGTESGWVCRSASGETHPVDMQDACNQQHPGSQAAQVGDGNSSWRCGQMAYLGGLDLNAFCKESDLGTKAEPEDEHDSKSWVCRD